MMYCFCKLYMWSMCSQLEDDETEELNIAGTSGVFVQGE